MKRILACLLIAAIASGVNAATLVPIQLLNPAGSASGWAPVSTGPTTPPAWTSIPSAASPTFTGIVTVPTPATTSNTTVAASTAFVQQNFTTPTFPYGGGTPNGVFATTLSATSTVSGAGFTSLLAPYALLASPSFTGLSNFANTASGASVIRLTGDGATTPNKFVGVLGGTFTIYSSSGGTQLLGLSDSGTLTVSNIAANSTGTQATAGNQGFAVSYSTGAASATAGSPMNVASTTTPLSVGVWDVTCTGQFVPAGSTVTQAAQIGVSTTSGALPGYAQLTNSAGVTSAGFSQVFTSPSVRIPVTTPTTVYCVAQANFTVSTMTIGGTITARLVH